MNLETLILKLILNHFKGPFYEPGNVNFRADFKSFLASIL
jgi:hypothetical protein